MAIKRCPVCDGKIEDTTRRMDFYRGKIKINPVKIKRCTKCGAELLSGEEYERIRLKLEAIKNFKDENKIKEVIAII